MAALKATEVRAAKALKLVHLMFLHEAILYLPSIARLHLHKLQILSEIVSKSFKTVSKRKEISYD